MSEEDAPVRRRAPTVLVSPDDGPTVGFVQGHGRQELLPEVRLADLPVAVRDHPAAVLLVDVRVGRVVFVNDVARELAPGVSLPVDLEDWSRAAGLCSLAGRPLPAGRTSLSEIALGRSPRGLQVSTAGRPGGSPAPETLWVTAVPLHGANAPLHSQTLLVLLPVQSTRTGVGGRVGPADVGTGRSVVASGLAVAISDPRVPDTPLIWVSPSFEQLTGYPGREVVGRNCRFLQGPDTDPEAVSRMRSGMVAGETTGATLLNYRRDGSAFYNHFFVSPVYDADGALAHLVSVQSDVTERVLVARERDAAQALARRAGAQAERAHYLAERARTAQAGAEEARRSAQLLLALSEAMTATSTVDDVARTITAVLVDRLGASGGDLFVLDPAGTELRRVSLDGETTDTDVARARIGCEEDAPAAVAVRTHRSAFHRDRLSLLAAHPGIPGHGGVPVTGASAHLPLIAGGEAVGALVVLWEANRQVTSRQREALQVVARYTAEAVRRAVLVAERRTVVDVLQRSLLTNLPRVDRLELHALYRPAAQREHVGGDWYDAVPGPDGSTNLIIGDVTGHDIEAAALMGQMRGLLRAFAFEGTGPPGEVVARLDRALAGLGVDGLATVLLARVERGGTSGAAAPLRVRWTNAGHAPPVLLHADGSVDVLETEADLLVGLVPGTPRSDHVQDVPVGSTLLLFTDGLLEGSRRSIDEGLVALRRVLRTHARCGVEELLGHVVDELAGGSPDDDCTILAARVQPGGAVAAATGGPGPRVVELRPGGRRPAPAL